MFDGNGNWTSDFSAQADRDNGIKILASRFDNIFIADIKESFENCLTKDGQIAPISDFNMGGQKITNLQSGVNDGDAVNLSQLNTTISNTLEALYPVGSIYVGTQTTCPLATLISGSTWELVATNRALWGGDGTNANTWIAAGLPNITGSFESRIYWGSSPVGITNTAGAFNGTNEGAIAAPDGGGDLRGSMNKTFNFNASNSNSIYGNSTTVQPPAYVVNVWRRTA